MTPAPIPASAARPSGIDHVNVIGGSGFIGTRLCELFAREGGPRFTIIDKVASRRFPQVSVIRDIRDAGALAEALVPGSPIIHLAAEHRDDVRPLSLYHDVNVAGTANVCRAAAARSIDTILFTSSVAVYGMAPAHTGEDGAINPFNEYGRTKWGAEGELRRWHAEASDRRTLVIVRPTVVFGENNRGNVYNLLRQIATGRFAMIGNGRNHKSMAYVGNVVAFFDHCLSLPSGLHLCNYVDQPDLSMNDLVGRVRGLMGKAPSVGLRIPFPVGMAIGTAFDVAARLSGRTFPISRVRVRKFCAETSFTSAAGATGFIPPVSLPTAIERTVRHEFLESHAGEELFAGE